MRRPCDIVGPARCMQLAATVADREPSQSGLLLPESVPVHTIDEHQLLTGVLTRAQRCTNIRTHANAAHDRLLMTA